jgi:hypothetical protein
LNDFSPRILIAEVAGIAGTVDDALALADGLDRIDAATVDLQLGHQPSWPVATALQAREVPILFTTGAPDIALPATFAGAPRLGKPFTSASLRPALAPLVALPETGAPRA